MFIPVMAKLFLFLIIFDHFLVIFDQFNASLLNKNY